ncbi:MAG: hypothetical protein QW459_03980 [Sulfolobales archaeon]
MDRPHEGARQAGRATEPQHSGLPPEEAGRVRICRRIQEVGVVLILGNYNPETENVL